MTLPVQIRLDSRQRVFALVTAMTGMVESAVDQAMEALLQADSGAAQTVLQKENVINRMEMHIDAAVLYHLAQKNLSTAEIRAMACVLKVNKNLERMGDLAANIARKVIDLGQSWEHSDRAELQPMAIAVSHVCRKALRAVVRQDLVLAESVAGSEHAVRTYRDYASRRIRERLGRGHSNTNSDLALLLASRSMEQIAGHAASLADNLTFWIQEKAQHALLAG